MSRKRFAVVFLKKKNGFQIPDIIGKMAKSAKVIYEEVHIFGLQQKSESQKRCYKKAKHAKFSEKQTFLTP